MTVKEAQVRDSLATCLEKIEHGLKFIKKEAKLPSSIGTTGFIDLLAKDIDGRYVLVEVKKSGPATREAIHEILKYIENAKSHLGLRENELRVIVASVEWKELLVPFSSFVERTSCRVEGYRLEVDSKGGVTDAHAVEPLPIQSERVLAPWHELRFYLDEESLLKGISSYEIACAKKSIDSFVLVIMEPPIGHPNGFPSTKEKTNRDALLSMVISSGQNIKNVSLDLYKYVIYFSMHQLTRDDYISRLPVGEDSTKETLDFISDMDEEEALFYLHEAVLDLEPQPTCDYLEVSNSAKFRSRLIQDEGWRVKEIRRYGYFDRNSLLSDDTIIEEIGGAQGNSKQNMKLVFRPDQKSEVAEVKRRLEECLGENDPWKSQIIFALDELTRSGESRSCYITVYNASSAITTIYLAATREDGIMYIPTYHISIPENNPEIMYYGVLKWNGSKAWSLKKIIDEFYDGLKFNLLFTLQWGGYESRDVSIVRRLGLRYKTYKMQADGSNRNCFELDDHQWESCDPVDHVGSYHEFLNSNKILVKDVCELYGSHWDGRIVNFSND